MNLRMIHCIKILSYHSTQRYAIRQTLWATLNVLKNENPEVRWEISEVKDWAAGDQHYVLATM
jgi:glutaredoxin-related protein